MQKGNTAIYIIERCSRSSSSWVPLLSLPFFQADLLPAESRNDGGSPALGFGGGERITDDRLRGLEERRKRCLEWCLDHGFEYVEADCRDANKGKPRETFSRT